ncbi:MAG: F510_1955 family glycosylhydrolase [Thermoleophilaceae bacterium]
MAKRRRDSEALKQQRRAREGERARAERRRQLLGFSAAAVFALVATAVVAIAVTAGGDDGSGGGHGGSGPDLAHVHGLGVSPKDGTLYIATHTGLFRAPPGRQTATRVGDSQQDVMGFSVVGPDRFLGSGHPGPGQDAPPNLGLIHSGDAGRSWEPVSLLGEADFHVLRSQGSAVYGFNGLTGALMVRSDGGRDWDEHEPPGPTLDLAIHPEQPSRVVASTDEGLFSSSDEGRGWRSLADGRVGFLAWPEPERLYMVDGAGRVSRSGDGGQSWREMGSIDAQPAAFAAARRDLYAALPDGTIKRSSDDGASWTVRAEP